ncbi:MAG: TerC family protein [Phycisphaerae bacterium]
MALLMLAGLEIVLGIDNIIFIAILTGKLDPKVQPMARQVGLAAAMVMRILLLFAISWIMKLEGTLFSVMGNDISGRELILILGGLFLLAKSTYEIHDKLEGSGHTAGATAKVASFGAAIAQIMMVDLVFSIDSVITAVGVAKHIEIMVVAVIVSVAVMMAFAGPVCRFIEAHPTMKILGLSFLLLIGTMLMAEGMGAHVGKGYIYFAMGFSFFVEMLNIRFRKVYKPVQLHTPPAEVVEQK